jgi:hypothetical protein
MELLDDHKMGQKWHTCALEMDRKSCMKIKYGREQIAFTLTTASFCAALVSWTAAAFNSSFLP